MAGGNETPEQRKARDQAVADADQAARDAEREAAHELTAAAVPSALPRPGGPNATLTAAAASIRLDDRKAIAALRRRRQGWHDEACDYVKEIGELGYVVEFSANLMSKLRLFPAVRPEPGAEPVPVTDEESGVDADTAKLCVDVLERLRSPQGGQSALLYGIGWNMEVTGDLYLHGHEVTPDEAAASEGVLTAGEEMWFVRSVRQLVPMGEGFVLRTTVGSTAGAPIPVGDAVKRLFNPDPEFDELSTSPVRRVLSICENLLLASRTMRAVLMSHLPAGFLVKPQELTFGSIDPTRRGDDGEAADDPFEQNLQDILLSPIQEPGSAAAIAPGLLTGPAEFVKKDLVWHLTFARPIDQLLVSWIEGLVMRLARGMNMPVEVTTGLQMTTFCVDEATEILTRDGWRRHGELNVRDEVLTLNHDSGEAEWQPTSAVNRWDVQDRQMLLLDGKAHSSLTTGNHRWPALRYREGGWHHEPTRDTPVRRWLDSKPRGAMAALAAALDADGSYVAAIASGRIRPSRRRAETIGHIIGIPAEELLAVDVTATRGERAEATVERIWTRTDEMDRSTRLVTAAPCADLPTDPKWSDDMVELVAWFYTEGSVDRRGWRDGGGQATISQSLSENPAYVARIRGALHRLVGPPVANLQGTARSGERLWVERKDKNKPMARFVLSKTLTADFEVMAPDRVPTAEFIRSLTRSQLELFLETSRAADGWIVNSGTPMFSQCDPRRVDGYELACILSGRTPSRWSVVAKTGRYAGTVQHYCSITDRSTVQPVPDHDRPAGPRYEWTDYTGTIWCPTTENGSWLARRDGHVYFTGNSNAATVKQSEWDSHGEPRAILIVDSITVGYYREALVKSGVPAERAADIFVWYDPSACIAAPDQTDSADHGSLEGLIRDEAWRRVRGYSDADAPSDDELLRRLAYAAPRMDPFLAAQLWRKTGMFPDVQVPAPPAGIVGPDGQIVGGPPSAGEIAAAVTDRLAASGFTAAARPRKGKGAALGRKLAAIDRDLRTRVHVAAEQALRRAMERAGAKIRPKLGRTGPAAEAAAGVPNRLVAAAVGRDVVTAAVQGTLDFGGEFDELADDLGAWVEVVWRQALDAVQAVYGPISQARVEELAGRLAQNVPAAQEQLKARMVDLAAQRLFDPTPGVAAIGEADVSSGVPAYVAREALAIAGGDQPTGGDGAPLTSEDGSPVGGVATGPDVMGETGGVEGYVWDYGAAPRTPFPPHEALDGVTFVSFDDDVLANDEGWPADYCMPGDHDGCVCDASPILLDPAEADGGEAEGE